MNLTTSAAKLFTNRYFLYAVTGIAALNLLAYLAMRRYNAALFFALVGLVTYHFSKNMAVVLLVAMFSTAVFTSGRFAIVEGMEDGTTPPATTSPDSGTAAAAPTTTRPVLSAAMERAKNTHPDIASVSDALENDPSKVQEVKDRLKGRVNAAAAANPGSGTTGTEPVGAGERVGGRAKGGSGGVLGNGKGAKLDYAATLSEAYDNLDKMLGSDGIKQLSNDTQKLMQQQQNLFGTMEQFVPILENAQNMLNKLDMSGINKIAGMANSLGLGGGGGKGAGSAPVAANA